MMAILVLLGAGVVAFGCCSRTARHGCAASLLLCVLVNATACNNSARTMDKMLARKGHR
jgi:hypothetical protein